MKRSPRWKVGISQLAFGSLFVCFVIASSPCSQAQVYGYFKDDPATTLPTGDWPAYQRYVSGNGTVAGVTVLVPWAEYDNGSDAGPSVNTTKMGTLVGHLNTAAAGGPINFIIVAASGGSGSGGVNTATPYWVFDPGWLTNCMCSWTTPLDVCYCNNYQGTTGIGGGPNNGFLVTGSNCYNQTTYTMAFPHNTFDYSGVPAAWEPPFVAAYQQWLGKFFTWVKANVSNVGYVRIGVGTGGGSVVPCPNVEEGNFHSQLSQPVTPLTESIWLSYNQGIYSAVALDVGTSLIVEASMFGGEIFSGGDGMIPIDWADNEAAVATANGFGLNAESLSTASDIGDNVLTSAGSPCSNDWCAIFSRYYKSAPILGLQTLSQSDPNCLGAPSSCNTTSSLLTALPFATQHRAKAFEIYYEDLLCAYDSGYTNSTPYGACEAISAGRPYYSAALADAAANQPTNTAAVGGAAGLSGKTSLQ